VTGFLCVGNNVSLYTTVDCWCHCLRRTGSLVSRLFFPRKSKEQEHVTGMGQIWETCLSGYV